jgi:hypothetical protein
MTMRTIFTVALAFALIAGPISARAQDDPTPGTQAALDTVRTALDGFAQATSYTGQLRQTVEQVIAISYLDQSVVLTQTIKMEGTTTVQQAPQQTYAARQIDFVQSISQTLTGGGLDETTEIGPVAYHVRVVDDRFYLRVEADDPAIAAQFPAGWRDITGGASAFPGMSMFDIEGVLAIDGNLSAGFSEGLLDAVTDITQEESAELPDKAATRYRLELDPARTLDLIGLPTMTGMFEEGRVPFDVPALIETLFNDEATRYTVHVTVEPGTNALVEYSDEWTMDVEITPDLITDPSLEGATMTLEQHSVQSFRPTAVNEPVTITAPEIAE